MLELEESVGTKPKGRGKYVRQGRQLDERSRWQQRFVRNHIQTAIKFDHDQARVGDLSPTLREDGIVRREKTSGYEEGR